MPIEDVFGIKGRGTVVTGPHRARRGERGRLGGDRGHQADRDNGRDRRRDVQEAARRGRGRRQRRLPAARRGPRGRRARAGAGAARESITPHRKFSGEVYVLSKEEGGRHTPFFTGYRPQFYVRTTDVTGVGDAAERYRDGDARRQRDGGHRADHADCDRGWAALRDSRGGRTVGAGVVTGINE